MTRGLVVVAALSTLAVTACSGSSGSARGPGPSASATSSAPPSTPPPAAPSASAKQTTVAWTGTYTSAAGSLYVRDGGEWRGVRFRGDDASVGLGEGPLSFTLDSQTGRVVGAGSGPIGDFLVTGAVTGDSLAFSVVRKDARDRGLTGTGIGKVNGESLVGKLRLSQGDAHVIREATFSLARKTP